VAPVSTATPPGTGAEHHHLLALAPCLLR